MSRPAISSQALSDTLTMSECHADMDRPYGFWLYDKTRGMNLAMGAKTREDALVKALTYYQKRLADVESDYKELNGKVEAFINQFATNEE